jgi:hypothetical protein
MKMAFTPTDVNGWLFTIAGLDAANGNAQPVPEPFLNEYVNELNPVPPATTPAATPAVIQANLENFPVNANPPPANVITDTFFRTTVADFVLREFQLAWGVVPTSGAATSQYDAWVARVIDNPANMTAGGMSQALAGTTNFMIAIGATSPDQPATIGMINALAANAGVAVGAGAMANVGLPIWQVLQNFAESTLVSNALAAPIANFQNLLLNAAPGAAPPAGNLLTLSGTPGASLTLTTGVDTQTTGFAGHGATATAADAVFLAPAGTNPLGASNTLNAGDILVATGAALGTASLNFTAVASPFGNPPVVVGVTMNGVNAATITNLSGAAAGFSGDITGLTIATVAAASTNEVDIGTNGVGLNTALATVNINAGVDFRANMTAAALAAAPSATINLSSDAGPVGHIVQLLNSGATTGYASLTINSNGSSANVIDDLDIGTATNTATITAAGAEALTLSGGTALNIDNLHTFTGNNATTPDTGGLDVTFANGDGAGHVAVTGGSGVNTFTFLETGAGAASFTTASTVDGGTGATNTLDIQAATGAILLAGVGAGITDIQTIEHTGAQGGAALTADLSQMGSATTFNLAGDYSAAGVTVSDITNAQTVEFSGTGGVVSLEHTAPTPTSVINLEMNGVGPADLILTQLVVGADLPTPQALLSLNIDSTGSAGDNDITNAATIGASINITGATHLTLGSDGSPYTFAAGTIDATAATGGVAAFLAPTPLTAQTFDMGTGTNVATVIGPATGSGGGVIDFAGGGTDTVEFHAFQDTDSLLNDNVAGGHNYNNVLNFTNANGTVNLSTGSFAVGLSFTDNVGSPVPAGAATTAANFSGVNEDLSTTHANYINFTQQQSFAGDTAVTAFNAAMGGAAITVSNPGALTQDYIFSLYDTATSEAVLGIVQTTTTTIAAGDPIAVIGLIHMSSADYTAGLANHTHFVA